MANFTVGDAPKFVVGDEPAVSPPSDPSAGSVTGYLKQEIVDPVKAAISRLGAEFEHPGTAGLPTVGDVLAVPEAAIGGAANAAIVSPAASALSYLHPQRLDNPWASLFGAKPSFHPESHQELEGDVRGMAMGIAPEAGAAPAVAATRVPGATDIGVSDASLSGRAANKVSSPPNTPPPNPDHLKAVEGLKKEGVELTPGQMKGGWWRRQEEAQKSNPLVGQAIRDAENKSITSMNRAVYNRVLAPIGKKYEGDAIGNEGVKKVGDIASAEYEKLKPKLKFQPDDAFVDHVVEARNEGGGLPGPQERQLENLINNHILKRLGPDGSMDGQTFKEVESQLTNEISKYRGSQNGGEKAYAGVVEDVLGAMRDNLERSSDPGVRDQLKKLNTTWALLRRMEGAAGNRAQSSGVFTVGDLMSAIKRADKSSGKRAFARGDAMLQDFGDMATRVIPNRLPDSGTVERLEFNKPGGLAQGAVSAVTNPIASRVIKAAQETGPASGPVMASPVIPNASYLYPTLAYPSLSDAMKSGYTPPSP